MNVYPDDQYVLVTPTIIVNGHKVKDEIRDIVSIQPAAPITFEVEGSTEGSTYQWDFGDDTSAEGVHVTHRYSREEYFPVVTLRVIDKHNIFVDTYAMLDMPFQKNNLVIKVWYMVYDFVRGLFYKE
jgi:hypothetical protein